MRPRSMYSYILLVLVPDFECAQVLLLDTQQLVMIINTTIIILISLHIWREW